MNARTFSLFLLLGTSVSLLAQADKRKEKVATHFIDCFNRQDYKKMRKPFSAPVKMIMGRKVLKNWFGYRYEEHGKIITSPDRIVYAGNRITIPLSYERDTTVAEYMNLVLNKKGRIVGFGVRPDYFVFPPVQGVSNYAAYVDTVLATAFPDQFNGTVLFAEGENIVFSKHYGYRDLASKAPLDDNSVFELASCSKQFTAAGILKLEEMGRLSVDDSLSRFFPQLPYKGITLRHLLIHTSGLPDYMELLMSRKVKKAYCFNEDIISELARTRPKARFAPGERYEYSNTGYAILASVIEKVSGMSYGEFLKTQFFDPLGMTRTRVYNTRRTKGEVLPDYAYGYVYSEKDKKYMLPDSIKGYRELVTKLDGIVGDGTVNTTAADLIRWNKGLNSYQVLSKASLDKAYTSGTTNRGTKVNYGFGVEVHNKPSVGTIISHTGGWPGYKTLVYRFVDQDKMLVILSNKDYPKDNIVQAARRITPAFLSGQVKTGQR